ncbi:hypothetical protein EJ06DRAFT_560599 [Trichodelitschia bisporula]|uniref:Uncharacterized protein n=1 Tax=Trichodelitschia bisporula TaxID=703511 RepID=A0A6G1HIB0_9PEZI|nr:hypothetical protein EJ06DRAFT_560599 [Trichodelitschia bisporula]
MAQSTPLFVRPRQGRAISIVNPATREVVNAAQVASLPGAISPRQGQAVATINTATATAINAARAASPPGVFSSLSQARAISNAAHMASSPVSLTPRQREAVAIIHPATGAIINATHVANLPGAISPTLPHVDFPAHAVHANSLEDDGPLIPIEPPSPQKYVTLEHPAELYTRLRGRSMLNTRTGHFTSVRPPAPSTPPTPANDDSPTGLANEIKYLTIHWQTPPAPTTRTPGSPTACQASQRALFWNAPGTTEPPQGIKYEHWLPAILGPGRGPIVRLPPVGGRSEHEVSDTEGQEEDPVITSQNAEAGSENGIHDDSEVTQPPPSLPQAPPTAPEPVLRTGPNLEPVALLPWQQGVFRDHIAVLERPPVGGGWFKVLTGFAGLDMRGSGIERGEWHFDPANHEDLTDPRYRVQ